MAGIEQRSDKELVEYYYNQSCERNKRSYQFGEAMPGKTVKLAKSAELVNRKLQRVVKRLPKQ